ncbi:MULTISPECIES: response regulator [Dyella]|nr:MULTISPECIES: response regulator [Dyella]
MGTVAGRRLLLVEDDPQVAMVVDEVLSELGLEVLVNQSFQNAQEELDAGDIDVAVLDMFLRGESALPIARKLHGMKVPFLVLTGGDPTPILREFPDVTVMSKPFQVAELEHRVMRLLCPG